MEAVNASDLGGVRQRLLYELQEAAALAKAKGDPMAMVAAWREIGKVVGLYQPERIKVDLNIEGQVEMNRMNHLSDGDLLRIIQTGHVAAL